MAYELDLSIPLNQSLKDVASEQLARALAALEEGDPSTLDERVHSARKCLKKTRAVLRLVRPSLPGACFRRENAALRDAARSLAGARDQAAALECLARLQHDRPGLTDTIARLESALRGARDGTSSSGAAQREATRAMIREAHARLPDLIRAHVGKRTLERGLSGSHRRGRHALAAARGAPSPEHFHEWRKQVKDHWYTLRLLRQSWPNALDSQIAELEVLSELLGDEHDLHVVRARVVEPRSMLSPYDMEVLLDAIDRRVADDRARAVALGARVYAEKPGAFARRLTAYLAAPELKPEVD